jgi:DNA-binding transcriptional MocR family regulator
MIRGGGTTAIASSIEGAIAGGELGPGERLPSVRALATELGVSPATVAGAYRTLSERGLVTGNRRQGTVVATQPPLRVRGAHPLPPDTRDLASGNPDPALLPQLEPAIAQLDPAHKLYGGPVKLARLVELAGRDFAADGISGDIGVVGGALDGIERALQSQLRPGDRVVVEDPSWPRINDLVRALTLIPEPAAVDAGGLSPGALARALDRGAKALIVTPRGQNPTGAAIDAERAARLREVLAAHAEVLVLEDDYVAAVAGASYAPLHGTTSRWAVIRSLSKVFGPDLRIATMAADPLTASRIEGRQLLGSGWVSHLLQQTAANIWAARTTKTLLARATRTYAERRQALVDALAERGITAGGESGLGVWVPVDEEARIVQLMLERGWAVSPGERFRFRTPPGIRITTTTVTAEDARELAAVFAAAIVGSSATYAG